MKKRILLQTTIPFIEDDWHVGRFSELRRHLDSLRDSEGNKLYAVTARNREANGNGDDPMLSMLDESDSDQLWLFAVDSGGGLSKKDCEGITRFRQRGGGIFSARDHQDLGVSICSIGGIGTAHYFHSKNREPDESRHYRDDTETTSIDYPNYHSGSNGDFQRIEPVGQVHELLRRDTGDAIEFFPAHPHEGSVGEPPDEPSARVIARGTSSITGRTFNLLVAFEKYTDQNGHPIGRGIAESSFHHFVDYNWNPEVGCPTFVAEKPGNDFKKTPEHLNDVKRYIANLAAWLSG